MGKSLEVTKWKAKAESDFTAANDLFKAKSSSTDAICFHCQQAVEKYLKALLINCGMEFQRTHDLMVLAEILSSKYPELEEFKEDFSRLTFYAVDIRYPNEECAPDAEEMRKALKCVKSVRRIFNSIIKTRKK
ncbi:MAG: HEPN domain-containing protein [Victivallales bacterium]